MWFLCPRKLKVLVSDWVLVWSNFGVSSRLICCTVHGGDFLFSTVLFFLGGFLASAIYTVVTVNKPWRGCGLTETQKASVGPVPPFF